MSKLKTTDLDAIIASVPVNKTAARQLSGGIHWTPDVKLPKRHADAPNLRAKTADGEDLTGTKVGRLTVVGVHAEKLGPDKPRLWQVRCVCGQYEVRRRKSILNPANTDDCCAQCYHLKVIKKREYFRRYGRYPGANNG